MVVIVDRIYYMSSMYEIVNDTPKFLRLRSDPTICRENKLQRFLRSLKNQVFFTKDVYDNIYPCGSKPARMYGNPETHKLKCKTYVNVPPYSFFHRCLQLQTGKNFLENY